MTDRLLISREDFFEYEAITMNTSPDQIMPFVREAQKFDLSAIIGRELIADMQDNLIAPNYQDLLPYLRPVLVYQSYARYVQGKSAVDTPFGFVQKTNDFSQPVSEKTIGRLVEQARNTANAYARELIEYLRNNASSYPLFQANCQTKTDYRQNNVITNVNTKDHNPNINITDKWL